MPVIATFLTEKTGNRFHTGVFNSKGDGSNIVGNIELNINGTYPTQDDIGKGKQDDLYDKKTNAVVSEFLDFSPGYNNEGSANNDSDPDVACVVPSGEINPFKASLDADGLLKVSAKCVKDIPFDETQMGGMFEHIVNVSEDLKDLDTVFWCPKVTKGDFHDKLINVMFLDGTFLKKQFGTLLNLVAVTTNNRIIPLAHMLHKGNENNKNTCVFLDLVKRYIPVDWNKTHLMCDQSSVLEGSILKVMGSEPLTCSIHLLRNLVKHTHGNVIEHFKTFLYTLDKDECSRAQKEIEKSFHEKARTSKNATWKKVSEKPHLFCRSHRTDAFEQFTTNAVEQFHSSIGTLKRGNMINLVSQLSMIQLSGLNELAYSNKDDPRFSKFGAVILSINISLALLFSVEIGEGSFTVTYKERANFNIYEMYASYMKCLKRNKSYASVRRSYLTSLIKCHAETVTDTSCSLFNYFFFFCNLLIK